jgi:heme/copper-type cytochrome/quinol oxidase subunit 2
VKLFSVLRWILLSGAALLVIVLPLPSRPAAPIERLYRIEASRFAYSPAVLTANPGDRVTIELVATDVVHGLSIDGYNLAVTGDPGQTARLTFVADQTGTFHFRCQVTCGNMHPFMVGKLQVGQNVLFLKAAALAVLMLVAGLWKARQ